MKNCILPVISLVLSATACQSLPPEIDQMDRAQIQSLSTNVVAAYNQDDLDQFVTVFTPDAIVMPPHEPAVNGHASIMKWKADHEPGLKLASVVEHMEGSGDTAYMRGRYCLFQLKEDGSYEVNPGKFLETLKLQADESWLVDVQIFNSDIDEDAEWLDACPFAESWD